MWKPHCERRHTVRQDSPWPKPRQSPHHRHAHARSRQVTKVSKGNKHAPPGTKRCRAARGLIVRQAPPTRREPPPKAIAPGTRHRSCRRTTVPLCLTNRAPWPGDAPLQRRMARRGALAVTTSSVNLARKQSGLRRPKTAKTTIQPPIREFQPAPTSHQRLRAGTSRP